MASTTLSDDGSGSRRFSRDTVSSTGSECRRMSIEARRKVEEHQMAVDMAEASDGEEFRQRRRSLSKSNESRRLAARRREAFDSMTGAPSEGRRPSQLSDTGESTGSSTRRSSREPPASLSEDPPRRISNLHMPSSLHIPHNLHMPTGSSSLSPTVLWKKMCT
uniref:Uncharacterized protein n=1 Tax=Noctiluca scintillans TaxID=2966 RepID=A0A7S0ZTI4_NOCSC